MVATTLSGLHFVIALTVDLALSLAVGSTHLTHHNILLPSTIMTPVLHIAALHIL